MAKIRFFLIRKKTKNFMGFSTLEKGRTLVAFATQHAPPRPRKRSHLHNISSSFCLDAKRSKKSRKINAICPQMAFPRPLIFRATARKCDCIMCKFDTLRGRIMFYLQCVFYPCSTSPRSEKYHVCIISATNV